MRDELIQPTRISKEEYIKFKQWVQDTHGTTRGHLATEIENALREYRQPNNSHDALARIENDVATIKAAVAHGESDGGTPISAEGTRAPDSTTNQGDSTTKPESNAPRQEKVDWILSKYDFDRSGGEITVGALKGIIQSEYNFKSGVIDQYVDMIITELDAKKHPKKTGTWAWGEKIEGIKAEIQEQTEKQVDSELDELNQAEGEE